MSSKQFLQHTEAVKKLQDLATDINICLFCSGNGMEDDPDCRPMATAGVDEQGAIWFISNRNSIKNKDIETNPQVKLFYSHPSKSSFLVVSGEAEIVFDQYKVHQLWNPLDKTWFKGGEDDPDISLIKVRPDNAHYWDSKGNSMVNFFKMIASVATGKTLVEGEEGSLLVG